MTRDNIFGLILITAILIGYSVWMAPSEEERMEARRQDSIAAVQQAEAEAEARLAEEPDTLSEELADLPEEATADQEAPEPAERDSRQEQMGHFSGAATGKEHYYTVENDIFRFLISKQGGHLHTVELKEYKAYDHEPLLLIDGEHNRFTFNFFSGNRNITTENLYFTPYLNGQPYTGDPDSLITADGPMTFSMRAYSDFHTSENPSYIEMSYGLSEDEYMIDYDVRFVGTREAIAANTTFINLDWQARLPRLEKNRDNEQNNTTIYYKYTNDEVSRIKPTRDDEERLSTSIRWISFKQQFFSSVLISEEGFANADIAVESLEEEEEDYLKDMSASINMDYDGRGDNSYHMQWYLGPTSYRKLTAYDLELEKQIPLGWGFFLTSWINRFAVIPVFNFLDSFELNYGIVILILTILLKLVLLPIAYKTYLSQAKMRLLKPEIDELGKKFPKKEDAMKKQQATMSLYKKAGVNPMSGCIPMLLQLPILIALFRFFPASIELRQEAFLWADDLSSYDSILSLPFSIPFYGDHVSLFTLLMAGSMIIYTHMNSQMMSSGNQMPGMKTMMYFMPVMLLGIFNNFASGLSYYYFLANVITFGQMFLFRRFIDEDALRAKMEANKKKPVKKSKWQQRMETLAKQQEKQKKQKRNK
ncbi:MAG: membrane protein insertase YidC [Bacteroidales bacterium]